ncbi:MAG TPA: FtsQ-type POTRA domain-containing protein [Bryobacteraceae bacterium]|nr:FtsQ-type POTRA domain-containing protein [Bryobacteraceae bacterium]
MPRKSYQGAGTLPGIEPETGEIARPRARSPRAPAEFPWRRLIAIVSAFAVFLLAALYTMNRLEKFLIRDERFALTADDDHPTLEVTGVSHASRRAVQKVFDNDAGRSIYLLPLADRRAMLRTVDWVKDATVVRLWPNRVIVKVSERAPVAFITVNASRFALIDEDGVILPPAPDRFTLPVLAGVRPPDPIEQRRDRVHRMLRLTRDLGPRAAQISEIDVSDPDNLKVTEPRDGHMVTLLLGDHDFSLRYQNFVRNYGEIKRRLPGAATLDMRLEDRITVVE